MKLKNKGTEVINTDAKRQIKDGRWKIEDKK